jgi:Mrp family chromosome partitioning ATPase
MILYLCSEEKNDLLNFLDKIPVKKMSGKRNLKKFIINSSRNFSAYSFLIVDIKELSDTEDEILEAVTGFKAMYDAKIIIIADDNSDELLSKLYDAGVRYFITARDPEDIKQEILGCFNEIGTDHHEGKEQLRSVSEDNSSNIADNGTEEIQLNYISTEIPEPDVKDKDETSLKKSKVIAVAGTANNVGTTTTALNLAYFLTTLGKVSYICSSLTSLFPDIDKKDSGGFVEHKGVNCYSIDGNLDLSEYDFTILDLNALDHGCLKPFLNADVRIICTTIMRSDLDKLPEFLKLVDGYSANFIFSFVPPGAQSELCKLVEGHQCYSSEFSPNMFDGKANKAIWQKIMNIEEHVKTSTEPITKPIIKPLQKPNKELTFLKDINILSSEKIENENIPENHEISVLDKLKKTSEEIKSNFHVPKINKPEFRKKPIRKTGCITRVIAVAGAAPGLGCTHNALAMAFFFSNLKYKVALVELGESHDLLVLGSLPNAKQKDENSYKLNGFDVFPRKFGEQPIKVESVLKSGYDVAILDLGVLKHGDSPNNAHYEMNRADVSILVASSAMWRWKDLRPFIENTQIEHWNILVAGNFNVKEMQNCIEKKVHCILWSDPLGVNTARDNVYEGIFEALLVQMKLSQDVQLVRRTSNTNNINRMSPDPETVMINHAVVDRLTTPDEHRG